MTHMIFSSCSWHHCQKSTICSFYSIWIMLGSNQIKQKCQKLRALFVISSLFPGSWMVKCELLHITHIHTDKLLLGVSCCRMNACCECRPFVCWLPNPPRGLLLALISTFSCVCLPRLLFSIQHYLYFLMLQVCDTSECNCKSPFHGHYWIIAVLYGDGKEFVTASIVKGTIKLHTSEELLCLHFAICCDLFVCCP